MEQTTAHVMSFEAQPLFELHQEAQLRFLFFTHKVPHTLPSTQGPSYSVTDSREQATSMTLESDMPVVVLIDSDMTDSQKLLSELSSIQNILLILIKEVPSEVSVPKTIAIGPSSPHSAASIFKFIQWAYLLTMSKNKSPEEQLLKLGFNTFLFPSSNPIPNRAKEVARLLTQMIKGEQILALTFQNILMNQIIAYTNRLRNSHKKKALLIIDVQNDFCEGGSLQVPNSNLIFEPINKLRQTVKFDMTVLTKDMHPLNHVSFATTHNLNPFMVIQVNNKPQELWPPHCVAGTFGADIHSSLELTGDEIIVNKGENVDEDSYSGFGTYENPTQMLSVLKEGGIEQVVVVGLALDFCVGKTALDAKKAGFEVFVMDEGTQGVISHKITEMLEVFAQNDIYFLGQKQVENLMS